MQIQTNVPLKSYSTMRLGGLAAYLAHVTTEADVAEAAAWAKEKGVPIVAIGGGSNIYWRDEGFPGLVLVNELKSYHEEIQPDGSVIITAGSGENWDDFVAKTVAKGYTGIESLSLIPGTVGATPVQNVGAYGQEISHTLEHIAAYDLLTQKNVTIKKEDCALAYRTSRFKTKDHGRFFITSVSLRLKKGNPHAPFYPALQLYLESHSITDITPQTVRDAVIAIRSSKLPDPKKVANNGSFFANPVVDEQTLNKLIATYGAVTHWQTSGNRYKLPAAWLLQETGFKDYHDTATGMGTWPQQPLVLVNEHASATADLVAFRDHIVQAVKDKFGITLEQEPQML
jgi:UDP-N-acetylmuramate dehydrogenase